MDNETTAMMSADLAGADNKQGPRKTWFFEREKDRTVFACEEKEAWEILYNRSNWRRRDFKLLGVSDGTTYQRVVREMRVKADALRPQLQDIERDLLRYKQAEENLLVNEAVDMDGHPADTVNEANKQKVIRLRGIIEKVEEKLQKVRAEFRAATADVNKTAFEAELEKARGNIEMPSEMNIITPGASPKRRNKIINLLSDRDD